MGLFSSKKIELEKDFFIAHFDKNKDSLVPIRERSGFKVTLKRLYSCLYLDARIEWGFGKGLVIQNKFLDNGSKECSLLFYGFDQTSVQEFINMNFRKEFNYFILRNEDKLVKSSLTGQPHNSSFYLIVNDDNQNSSAVIFKR